jgi:hypothetical protein
VCLALADTIVYVFIHKTSEKGIIMSHKNKKSLVESDVLMSTQKHRNKKSPDSFLK